MPTGYTAPLYEGKDITFAEFVMQCARAMGVLVTMRDDPMDAPIPETFQPSDYHTKQLKRLMKELERVSKWTDEQAEREAKKAYNRDRKYYVETLITRNERYVRYAAMLKQVKDWRPPTIDHMKFKEFMIEQLEGSIVHDCTGYPIELPVKQTGLDYQTARLSHINRDVDYHSCEEAAEIERAASRTDWIQQLRDSLVA